jgi:hypothetical protein
MTLNFYLIFMLGVHCKGKLPPLVNFIAFTMEGQTLVAGGFACLFNGEGSSDC